MHRALATTDGLASWWTRDTTGDASEGGKLQFSFGDGDGRSMTFEVAEVRPDRIGWRCLAGPDEWIDTTITFDLAQQDDETVLLFTHGGWREPVPFHSHCSTKWAIYLFGMKSLLEGGEATPYPRDPKVSSWD